MNVTAAKPWLTPAYEFYNLGLTPLPLQGGQRSKKPLLRSKWGFRKGQVRRLFSEGWGASPFSFERFDEMFALANGIGIVCGPCSDGLCVLDFDNLEAHRRWYIEFGEAVCGVPTVRTSRGVHYYFKPAEALPPGKLKWLVRGVAPGKVEVKAQRTYVVAPPSLHPSGSPYEWTVRLASPLPVRALAELGIAVRFVDGGAGLTSRNDEGISLPRTPTLTGSLTPTGGWFGMDEAGRHRAKLASAAVIRCLPEMAGERNRCLLRLCRSLKSIPELAQCPLKKLIWVIRYWCDQLRCLPFVSEHDFDANWLEFNCAWGAYEGSSLDFVRSTYEAICEESTNPRDRVLKLCVALSQCSNDGTFFLGGPTLASVLGKSQTHACRILRRLVKEGKLELLQKGKLHDRTANTYRVIP